MIVELLTKSYLSESQNHPQCVYDHIKSVITERDARIEEEYEESDDEEKDFMKLEKEDFRVVVWMIDNYKYYDICHFKDDAEDGFIMKYDNNQLAKICEVDEAALMSFDNSEQTKKWCETFEKERIRILDAHCG